MQTAWEQAQVEAVKVERQVAELQEQLVAQQQAFEQMGLPVLRQTKELLNQKRLLLNNAKHSLQAWMEAKLLLAQHEQEAASCVVKLAELVRQQG